MNGGGQAAHLATRLGEAAIIQILLIVLGAWLLSAASQKALPWLAGKIAGHHRWRVLGLAPVVRLLIILGSIVMIIPRVVEPNFQNLVALLGAVGLTLGFAFKDYISSLLGGIIALYEMVYRPGDWIKVDGAYGEVTKIGIRAVEIVTPDDTVVVIPHSKMWNSLIFNSNDGTRHLMCVAEFYLHPLHDAEKVKETLHDVALTSPFLQTQRPVLVIVSEKPWGTQYRLKAYPIDPREQFHFITDLTVRGKEALTRLGVQFAVVPFAADPRASS
ncbi:MAG: mechanosensitive ion channel family protein [Syntrophobacteraceae bacterium]